ncbi:hypothetical protein [Methylobacterium goesingense]|uniref:Uncharacterized protein n=1 Tax=Methylobacterium goesingense TaxID=243690 RepID=A0ABV2L233_9HYPH|nr:hypothetical protein [Methylobacterium goesingense]GJD72008.1 hypothetical protein CFIICLFH_0217 [Methylobacterium goesingense]
MPPNRPTRPIPSAFVLGPFAFGLFASSLLAVGPARAEFSLFGSAERTPANPFASNYASPPVRGSAERPRRVRRNAPAEAPRPPRDISR